MVSTPMRIAPLLLLVCALPAAELPPVAEPATATAARPRVPERDRWEWNRPQAAVGETGDLSWAPQPFRYEAGTSVRYIDFATGDDANPGTDRAKPWKHHPWDAAATGTARSCSGVQTYVFKRGTVYRGALASRESGTAGDPIRLTSDPSWGAGEAVISGAERVTGWTKGADRADIPQGAGVWWVDLPFTPRNVWAQDDADAGGFARVALARTPNWTVSDPEDVMSVWWTWEQPEWWTGKWQIDHVGKTWNAKRAHLGVDTKHLDQPEDYYVGATVRTEYGIVMGTPFPTQVEAFDSQRKGLVFQGIWTGDSEKILTGNRYYLEDKPQYLDSAGEFWFEKKGDGGRLHLRLPDDRDPNATAVEVARNANLIDSTGLEEVVATGLTFRHTNTPWELWQPGWGGPDVVNAAIRVRGTCRGLRIANCRFADLAGRALVVDASKPEAAFDRLAFTDNDLLRLDHGMIDVQCGGKGDAQVLRNRTRLTGGRPYRQSHGHGLMVGFPETMHVAGNIMERSYGAGIFVFGGKGSGERRDVALSRSLVHGNRVVDSLLAANDWGGIETWQSGPFYVFNNISGNANGYWNWAKGRPGNSRLGFAYYFDGSFKNAVFNNVAWGLTSDPASTRCANAAFYQATPTIGNDFFNNTASRFWVASNWSPAGGRSLFLGNLFDDISGTVFQHGQLKEDTGPAPAQYPSDSIGLARNLFAGCSGTTFGHFEADGRRYADLAAMQAALAERKPLAADIGTVVAESPVRDAEKRDFRPKAGSLLIDGGARLFVPWAIGRTVGEWHFRRNNTDPSIALDDHWYAAPYLVRREDYHLAPTWPLRGEGITAASYGPGPLEDWTDGALTLDGKAQRLVLPQAEMEKPYIYEDQGPKTVAGKQLATPDIDGTDLFIEAYVKPAKDATGTLAAKLDGATGYRLALNKAGGATLTLASGSAVVHAASGARIADGTWHHLVAELDRGAGVARIYTDGVRTAEVAVPFASGGSLSNGADLVAGAGFAGSFEYLRIARSSLAASRTTIEELYDWEFDGPHLRDFAGHAASGARRDAGAFEFVR